MPIFFIEFLIFSFFLQFTYLLTINKKEETTKTTPVLKYFYETVLFLSFLPLVPFFLYGYYEIKISLSMLGEPGLIHEAAKNWPSVILPKVWVQWISQYFTLTPINYSLAALTTFISFLLIIWV